ncbi:hypothetical protein V6Z11_A11G348800 [Gossypium hirsutum]
MKKEKNGSNFKGTTKIILTRKTRHRHPKEKKRSLRSKRVFRVIRVQDPVQHPKRSQLQQENFGDVFLLFV